MDKINKKIADILQKPAKSIMTFREKQRAEPLTIVQMARPELKKPRVYFPVSKLKHYSKEREREGAETGLSQATNYVKVSRQGHADKPVYKINLDDYTIRPASN